MARGGGPPNSCRITGTPSVSEVPSVGARAFCLLLRSSKVSRCKSGTHSSRYLNNGYVPCLIQHPGRLPGRQREQAPSPQVRRHTRNGVDTDAPLSGASPLPHLNRGLTVRWRSSARPPTGASSLATGPTPYPELCRYLWVSQASPLPVLLHPQHNLANMIPTLHPRMSLGRVGVGVHLVNDRQATPGGQHWPNVLAQLFSDGGFFVFAACSQK